MDKSEVSFAEYLKAKRRVDDRSLNRLVFASIEPYLNPQQGEASHLLELGAGLGTMIERLLDWGALDGCRYTAIDSDRLLLDRVPGRLAKWSEANQGRLIETDSGLQLTGPVSSLTVELIAEEIGAFLERQAESGHYNVILAHAVMDLLHLDRVLPFIKRALAPGGHVYFTINFDGHTAFEPATDPALDRRIVDAYHDTMDRRRVDGKPAGHSQTGRRLLARLPEDGFEIVRSGASDWVIHPRGGAYDQHDELVLRWILRTVEKALTGEERLEADDLREWVDQRQDQLEGGKLILIAHQIDVHARLPG